MSGDPGRNGFQAAGHVIVSGGLCLYGEDWVLAGLVLKVNHILLLFFFFLLLLSCSRILSVS